MGTQDKPLIRKTIVWRLIMGTVHVLYAVIWPTRVFGRDRVPRQGRVLIVANHQSFLDIPLVCKGVLHRHVAFVARDTLAKTRWLKFVLKHTGAILIDRTRGDRAALRAMARHLEAGDAVAIFPEGTRSRDGQLGQPKKGALLAARMAQAPILPCAVEGTIKAWPRGSRPRPARIAVHFGELIDSSDADAMERTWSSIASMLGQEQPGSPAETRASDSSAADPAEDPRPDEQRDTVVAPKGDTAD